MPLTLYNSLTRRESPFEPLEPPKVRMYCCGVTVYDYCHKCPPCPRLHCLGHGAALSDVAGIRCALRAEFYRY